MQIVPVSPSLGDFYFKMELNYFRCIGSPTVNRNVSIEWWLSEIKNGLLYGNEIKRARCIGKGNPGYDQIKESLPAVCWNFLFNGYKENANIINSTGYLYFDIDSPEFDITSIELSKVFSSFCSLSNQGKSIIVSVSGVTPDNFNSTYYSIASDLGIGNIMDTSAIKKTQFTVLTHDPGLIINPNSFVFNAIAPQEKVSFSNNIPATEKEKVSFSTNLKREEKKHIGVNDTFFKYNNLDCFVKPNDVTANKTGYDAIELYLPKEIKEGRRKFTLLAYCNNLICINPDRTAEEVFFHLMERNKKRCVPPLPTKEIKGIVYSVFKYKSNRTLKPLRLKKRKIIFGKSCGMDKKDKQQFVAETVGSWRSEKTDEKILYAINNHPEKKITANSIAIETGLGIATIKRHWKQFKSMVKEINNKDKSIVKVIPIGIDKERSSTLAEIILNHGSSADPINWITQDVFDNLGQFMDEEVDTLIKYERMVA